MITINQVIDSFNQIKKDFFEQKNIDVLKKNYHLLEEIYFDIFYIFRKINMDSRVCSLFFHKLGFLICEIKHRSDKFDYYNYASIFNDLETVLLQLKNTDEVERFLDSLK